MSKLLMALLAGVILISGCTKHSVVQPAKTAIPALMTDTTGGTGGSGGEDKPKPTSGG